MQIKRNIVVAKLNQRKGESKQ